MCYKDIKNIILLFIYSKPHALYSLRGASHPRNAKRSSSVARAAVLIRGCTIWDKYGINVG